MRSVICILFAIIRIHISIWYSYSVPKTLFAHLWPWSLPIDIVCKKKPDLYSDWDGSECVSISAVWQPKRSSTPPFRCGSTQYMCFILLLGHCHWSCFHRKILNRPDQCSGQWPQQPIQFLLDLISVGHFFCFCFLNTYHKEIGEWGNCVMNCFGETIFFIWLSEFTPETKLEQ